MNDYWMNRFEETVDKAIQAPSERTRLAYLNLAKHYLAVRTNLVQPLESAYRTHI